MSDTWSRVDMVIFTNATWSDAFQFGTPGDTTWSFTGQNFRLDVKGNKDDASYLLSVTSSAGQIVVDDAVNRVLHMNVPEATVTTALIPGHYDYDLVMFDTSSPVNRVGLMRGRIHVKLGITGG